MIDAHPNISLTPTYAMNDPAIEKITKVAQIIYGAEGIELSERAQENLARFTRWGFGELPVCIAKTQYSLSDDPKRMGAPAGWTLHVTRHWSLRGRRISSGYRGYHGAHARSTKSLARTHHRRGRGR